MKKQLCSSIFCALAATLMLHLPTTMAADLLSADNVGIKIEPLPLSQDLAYIMAAQKPDAPPPADIYSPGRKVAEGYIKIVNFGTNIAELTGIQWSVEAFSESSYNKPAPAPADNSGTVISPIPLFPQTYSVQVYPVTEGVVLPSCEIVAARFAVFEDIVIYDDYVPPMPEKPSATGSDPNQGSLSYPFRATDTHIIVRAIPIPVDTSRPISRKMFSTSMICIAPLQNGNAEVLNAVWQSQAQISQDVGTVKQEVLRNQGLLNSLYRLLFRRTR